jgi:hypothetical protein
MRYSMLIKYFMTKKLIAIMRILLKPKFILITGKSKNSIINYNTTPKEILVVLNIISKRTLKQKRDEKPFEHFRQKT